MSSAAQTDSYYKSIYPSTAEINMKSCKSITGQVLTDYFFLFQSITVLQLITLLHCQDNVSWCSSFDKYEDQTTGVHLWLKDLSQVCLAQQIKTVTF